MLWLAETTDKQTETQEFYFRFVDMSNITFIVI